MRRLYKKQREDLSLPYNRTPLSRHDSTHAYSVHVSLPWTVLDKHWQIFDRLSHFKDVPSSTSRKQFQYARLNYQILWLKITSEDIPSHFDYIWVIPRFSSAVYLSAVPSTGFIYRWLTHQKVIISPHLFIHSLFLLTIMPCLLFLCQTPTHLLDFGSLSGSSKKPSMIFLSPRAQLSMPTAKHIVHVATMGQFLSSGPQKLSIAET